MSPNKGDNVSLVADTPTFAEHRPATGIAPHHRSTSTRDGHRAAPAPPPVTFRAYISTDIKCKPSRRHSNTCKAMARNEHHLASSQHRLTAPHRTSFPTTNLPNIPPTYHAECCTTCSRQGNCWETRARDGHRPASSVHIGPRQAPHRTAPALPPATSKTDSTTSIKNDVSLAFKTAVVARHRRATGTAPHQVSTTSQIDGMKT